MGSTRCRKGTNKMQKRNQQDAEWNQQNAERDQRDKVERFSLESDPAANVYSFRCEVVRN